MLPCIMYTNEEFEILIQKYPELQQKLNERKDPRSDNCFAEAAAVS